jgi:hypothetical protein
MSSPALRLTVLLTVAAWYLLALTVLWAWALITIATATGAEDWARLGALVAGVVATPAVAGGFLAAFAFAVVRTGRSGWPVPAGRARAMLSGTGYAAGGVPAMALVVYLTGNAVLH